ncbi:MAG: D-ribose pyranase [Bacillota bacterium]
MKKCGILNRDISEIVAGMGHTDMLVVCDAGLPIPSNARRVDLALSENNPRFADVLRVILRELSVEKVIAEQETETQNPAVYQEIMEVFPDTPVEKIPHGEFKKMLGQVKAIIRTGEFTPYANVILVGGVVY